MDYNYNICILIAAKNGRNEVIKWLIENNLSSYTEKNNSGEGCALIEHSQVAAQSIKKYQYSMKKIL